MQDLQTRGGTTSAVVLPTTTKPVSGKQTMFLLVAAFLTHGIATQFGLIEQPLKYYMMKGLGLDAAAVSSYLAIMMLPWVLKPIYGLICDFVPVFGYRRRFYMAAANLLAALAFVVIALTSSLQVVLWALVFTGLGMATSTAVGYGLAISEGKPNGKASDYLTVEAFCYYAALIVSSIAGGLLCSYLVPKSAMHAAAAISALPALAVAGLVVIALKEPKTQFNQEKMLEVWNSLKQALCLRPLWLAALYIWCWNFSPSFGTPLYFVESKTLGFSQGTIGLLTALNSAGMLLGVPIYWKFIRRRGLKAQLLFAVFLGAVSTFGYLLLSSPASAVGLELFRGISNMIALLSIFRLAADVCPKGIEVSVMATLMAVWNLGSDASTYIGGQLFTKVFDNHLAPLVIVAGLATALCALLIPFLSTTSPEGRG